MMAVKKSGIPFLVAGQEGLFACPTTLVPPFPENIVFPVLVKPDLGRQGEGVRIIFAERTLNSLRDFPPHSLCLQPLLVGDEFRVTVCLNGAYAVAKKSPLDELQWLDQTTCFSIDVIRALHALLVRVGGPGAGFDVVYTGGKWVVLDINTDPSLAIHRAAEPPRDIATSFLVCWIKLQLLNQVGVPP